MPTVPGSVRIGENFPRKKRREEEGGEAAKAEGSRLVVGMNGSMATEKEKDANMKKEGSRDPSSERP